VGVWFYVRSVRLRCAVFFLVTGPFVLAVATQNGKSDDNHATYLGFDANDYPGEGALPELRKTFVFAGYWLNSPPSAKSNSWVGHRAAIAQLGFGFLVLFNGRLERELKSETNARVLAASDARAASLSAGREGFRAGTIIFVDQEEGGSMSAAQLAYLLTWFDGVVAAGFRAGIYCSGMPANEGHGEFTVTAHYIREHAGSRELTYFVYNDACPPSPGCLYSNPIPKPSASGVPFASIWQFAQSPRRRGFTRHCGTTYNADGRCYAPGMAPGSPHGSSYVDIESAISPDPSHTR